MMGNWPAMLLAPSLALTNLSITYALVTPSCARQNMLALHLVAAASLLLSLWFTFVAWRNWQQAGAVSSNSDEAGARRKVIASVAAMVGVLSCLVILAQWLPQWVLSPCTS